MERYNQAEVKSSEIISMTVTGTSINLLQLRDIHLLLTRKDKIMPAL